MSKPCHHSHAGKSSLSELTGRLRKNARKITGPRQAILEVLRTSAHPMSNREIFAALPSGNSDLATIYRSMHLLEEMGMVQRFDLGDGVARFELVQEGDDGHHHHLVCTQCAEVVEIDDCFPSELENKIASENGFAGVTHRLEFFGICPECQRGTKPSGV